MGIFLGISDLPVSTLHSALQGPNYEVINKNNGYVVKTAYNQADKFVSTQNLTKKTTPFVKMRNGIGKLMQHFSKIKR